MRRSLILALMVAAATAAIATPALSARPDAPQSHAHTHGPDGLALDRRARVTGAEPYEVDAHAPWSASEYDGGAFTTDQPDMAELGTLPMVHAVYVYPKDRASRFGQFSAMFQADARQASALLRSSYGYDVRFDQRLGADAVTRFLDISVLRSRHPDKKLSGSQQFALVRDELAAHPQFNQPDKKYLVWLDAGSRYCGQGQLYSDARRTADNYNERRTTAIVYRPYATSDLATGGFCRGRTALHELGHNLGALQPAAPNSPSSDSAHCNDSAEDVMCYRSYTSFDSGGAVFDYGNNDYWDPAATPAGGGTLPWWTVNLSSFLCPPAGCASPNAPPS